MRLARPSQGDRKGIPEGRRIKAAKPPKYRRPSNEEGNQKGTPEALARYTRRVVRAIEDGTRRMGCTHISSRYIWRGLGEVMGGSLRGSAWILAWICEDLCVDLENRVNVLQIFGRW